MVKPGLTGGQPGPRSPFVMPSPPPLSAHRAPCDYPTETNIPEHLLCHTVPLLPPAVPGSAGECGWKKDPNTDHQIQSSRAGQKECFKPNVPGRERSCWLRGIRKGPGEYNFCDEQGGKADRVPGSQWGPGGEE